MAVKNQLSQKEKRWADERIQFTQQVTQLQGELRVAKANSDMEVEEVRKGLLEESRTLDEKREKLDNDLNSHKTTVREFRAKELASDLKSKGVEVELQSLLDAEDSEAMAKDLLVEFQGKEIVRLKTQPQPGSPESVFESGSGGVVRKSAKDMPDAEFNTHWANLNRQAVAK